MLRPVKVKKDGDLYKENFNQQKIVKGKDSRINRLLILIRKYRWRI